MASIRRPVTLFVVVLLIADLAWGALYIHRTSFERDETRVFCLWDDAMISMTYARNAAEGFGLVWNPRGERVQGITNLGVTALMVPLHLLPLPAEKTSLPFQVLNLGLVLAIVLLLCRTARLSFGSDAMVAAAALAAVACAPWQLWSLQGSDVGLVALWLAVAVARLAAAGGAWPRGLFAWLAAGIFLRPDFALFYGVFWVLSPTFGAGARRRLAWGAAGLAAAFALYLGFGWLYYGDPLPNTVYLKVTGSPLWMVLRSGLSELLYWPFGVVTALPLAALAALRRWRTPAVRVCAGLVAAALAYNVQVGGDWKGEYGSRYLAPVLPFLLLLVAAGARELVESLLPRWPTRRRVVSALLLTLAATVLVTPQLALRDWFDPREPPMLRQDNERNYDLARYLRAHTLYSTTLGVHYGGVPPYFAERTSVDLLGKSDRHIARLEVDRFIPGHSKWDWGYVLRERRPDVFLATSRGLAYRPEFRRDYLGVRTPDGLRFYLRRDAVQKLVDPHAELFEPATGEPLDARGGPLRRARR